MSERLLQKRIAIGTLAALGMFGVAGCSSAEPNYEGYNQAYNVTGTIHDVEDDGTVHINENQLQINSADWRAEQWFEQKDGQNVFSDEFNFEPDFKKHIVSGFFSNCGDDVTVGHIFGLDGKEINAHSLQPGQVVGIKGHIREERYSAGKSGCQTRERNVYDSVIVLK
jgi:hypothetical protein